LPFTEVEMEELGGGIISPSVVEGDGGANVSSSFAKRLGVNPR